MCCLVVLNCASTLFVFLFFFDLFSRWIVATGFGNFFMTLLRDALANDSMNANRKCTMCFICSLHYDSHRLLECSLSFLLLVSISENNDKDMYEKQMYSLYRCVFVFIYVYALFTFFRPHFALISLIFDKKRIFQCV